jgi:hypothetical protein
LSWSSPAIFRSAQRRMAARMPRTIDGERSAWCSWHSDIAASTWRFSRERLPYGHGYRVLRRARCSIKHIATAPGPRNVGKPRLGNDRSSPLPTAANCSLSATPNLRKISSCSWRSSTSSSPSNTLPDSPLNAPCSTELCNSTLDISRAYLFADHSNRQSGSPRSVGASIAEPVVAEGPTNVGPSAQAAPEIRLQRNGDVVIALPAICVL